MSDEATPTKRGGRKSAVEKVESKKRPRKEVAKASDAAGDVDSNGATPAKRGRGRPPKGSKGKAASKPKAKGPGRRGRPKKGDKKDSSEDEGDDNEAEEEEEYDE